MGTDGREQDAEALRRTTVRAWRSAEWGAEVGGDEAAPATCGRSKVNGGREEEGCCAWLSKEL